MRAWVARMAAILAEAYPEGGPSLAGCAVTLAGMFDAGARDAEAIAFLAQEQPRLGGSLAPAELAVLTARLHRAAAGPPARMAT